MKTNWNTMLAPVRWGAAGALALVVGCAGAQKKEPASAASADNGPDLMAVLQPNAKKKDDRSISADQRADFEKAVAVYQKLKKSGSLKGGDCDEAAATFRRAADQTGLAEAQHNEAAVYLECGRKPEAVRIWEKLANGPRPFGPALTNLGYVSLENGDSSQAETLFNRAVQADPGVNSVAARINLAQILRDRARRASSNDEKKGLNDQAVRQLRTVLALDANNLQAYATLCYFYYDLGLPEAAKLIATQAIKKGEEIATGKLEDENVAAPASELAAADKGKKGKGKDDTAGPRRGRKISIQGTGWTPEMKKHIALVHNTLGLVALNKKSYVDATSSFRRAVEMDPELYEARLNLAAVSLKFRNYNVAEENFRAVIGAQPKNYEAMIGLGVALRGSKKFEEAEAQYLAAQKLEPQRADSYFNLGLLYQEYKGSEKPTLEKAQQFYRDFLQRSGAAAPKLRKDAERRIKDIDELFVAMEQAEKLQREAEELQRKAEEQQKKMEEEMRKQQDAEKKAPAAEPTAAAK